ncbi:MAG TPA: hypothetical protein VGE14_03410 [Marmoricola sp.]
MEWIRRNPQKAGLSVLAALLLAALLWAFLGGPGSSPGGTLGAEPLATPTVSSTPRLDPADLPSGENVAPTPPASGLAAQPPAGMSNPPGLVGSGFTNSLERRHVVIEAGSDRRLQGVGWRIPLADGARSGTRKDPGTYFRHRAVTYGEPDYAQLYTYVGPDADVVWCKVTVDGRVTDRQVARGPWGQVFCQG